MSPRQLCLISLSLLFAACGGSSSIAQDDLPAQLAVVSCQKMLACCSGTPGGPSEADCETAYAAVIQVSINQDLTSDNVAYDATAAANCLTEAKAASCEDLLTNEHTPSCNAIIVGTIANGGACTAHESCASDLCTNIPTDNNGPTGPGVCTAQAGAGASCPANTGTALGSYCAAGSYQSDANNTCVCATPKANGAACGSNEQCSSGLCDDANTHVCVAYPTGSSLPAQSCQELYAEF